MQLVSHEWESQDRVLDCGLGKLLMLNARVFVSVIEVGSGTMQEGWGSSFQRCAGYVQYNAHVIHRVTLHLPCRLSCIE